MRRAFAIGGILMSIAAGFFCCNHDVGEKSLPQQGDADSPPNNQSQITLLHVDAGKKEFGEFIKRAEQELDMKITIVKPPESPDSRHARISTMLASGDKSVDIFSINDEMISEFKGAGYLEPLTSRVMTKEQIAYYPKDYVEEMLVYEGEIYSLPYMMDVMAFWINQTYLEEASLDNIDRREDFQRFLDYDWGQGRYAYGGAWDTSYAFNEIGAFIHLFGGDYYDWQNAKTVEAVEFMKHMVENGAASRDSLIAQYEQINQQFLDGKIGVVFEYSGFMNDLAAGGYYGEDKIHMTALPQMGENTAYVATWQYGLNRASQNKEAAFRFLHYVAGEKASIDYAESMSRLPARQDIIRTKNLNIPGFEHLKKYMQGLSLKARPMTKNSMDYISRIGELFREYIVGESDITAYCEKMQKLVQTDDHTFR